MRKIVLAMGFAACAASAQSDTSKSENAVSIDPKLLLGEWCGEDTVNEYRWVHTVKPDGTFSTYFETLPHDDYPVTAYWEYGTWVHDGEFVSEVLLHERDVGEERKARIPPKITTYRIIEVTPYSRTLYYSGFDQHYVSTHDCDVPIS